MKFKFAIIILAISIFALFGCGEKKNDATDKAAGGAAQKKIDYKSGDEYFLKYGFTPGIKYTYKVTSTSENIQSQGPQSQSSKIDLKYSLTIDPMSVDTSGEIDLKIKFNYMKVDAAIGDQKLSYDSENPADTAKRRIPAFAEYVAFQNADFATRINASGEVMEIFRVDNILKNILAENAEKVNDNIKNQLRANIEDQLRSIAQQLFQYLPQSGVKINSGWEKTTIEKLGEDDAKNIAEYKLTSVENKNGKEIATVTADLKSETAKRKSVENKGAKYDFDKPVIGGKGTIEFDLESGIVVKRDLLTNVNLGMTVSQAGQTIRVITKVKNAVLVELEK